MPTGQIAGEVNVTCNYRRRQWGVLLLATTTQICAEGLRPEALVHLVVELQAQVVPEPVVGGPRDRLVQGAVGCLRALLFPVANQVLVGPAPYRLAVVVCRPFCGQTGDLLLDRAAEIEQVGETGQPVRRARRIIAAVPEGEADVTNAPPLAPRRTSS